MESFYIKLKDDYCILHYSLIHIELLPISHYLMDNGVITDKKVFEAFHYISNINRQPQKQANAYAVLNYRLAKTKNSSNQNETFSLEKIRLEYEKISLLSQSYQTIIDETKKHSKYLKSLTIEHIKERIEYSGLLGEMVNKKLNQLNLDSFSQYKYHYAKGLRDFEVYQDYNNQREKAVNEIQNSFFSSSLNFIIDFPSLFKNKFQKHLQRINNILDNQGQPYQVENDTVEDKFKEKKAYALFCEDIFRKKVFGFYTANNGALTDINQAKLFQNEAHVERYIKQSALSDVAVVEVNVKLEDIVKKVGEIDISQLELVKVAQEKEAFEQLISQEQVMNDVIHHLIATYGEKQPLLKEELLKIIQSKKEKNNKKIKV